VQAYGKKRLLSDSMKGGEDTHVGSDTSDDHLLLACGFDGGAELSVIPGIDLAATHDNSGVGVKGNDLRRDATIGT